MKLNYFLIISVIVFTSCKPNYDFSSDFDCTVPSPNNLEEVTDFKRNFSIELPKNWKTNMYYDDVVSSIYSADTTKSLTSSVIIDASHILNPIEIDAEFISKISNENEAMELTAVSEKKIQFLNRDAYYNLTKGKKGNFEYHLFNLFAKTDFGFLHVKTQIYGDTLVNERLCSSLKLIEKIRLK